MGNAYIQKCHANMFWLFYLIRSNRTKYRKKKSDIFESYIFSVTNDRNVTD